MINWSNSDKLLSWKKLMSLKGMVSVAKELSGENAAERVNSYTVPMGGNLKFN